MDFGFLAGDTDKTIYVRLRDSTSGLAKTGLLFNSTGVVCSFVLPLAARVAITLVTQTVTGAHTDGGFVEVDATNCKGLYRLDLTDAAIASGDFSLISIEFDGIIEETMLVELHARKVNTIEVSGTTQTAGDLAAAVITNAAGVDIAADIIALQTSIDGVPTNAEFEARTLVAASYFDPAADTVANVTLVATTTTNTDMVGTDGAFLAASAPTNFSALVITAGGAADALVQGFLNNTIAETTADNISNNFEVLFDNANSTSTSIIDDIENVAADLATVQTSIDGVPTNAEFNARTLVAASYFDPAADAVANVTLVATTTTNTDMVGTNSALLASTFSTQFSGMTSIAEWMGLLAGKQAGNATAVTEIKATGAGSGTYDPTTDSGEARRDRGDVAWITSTLVATDIVSAGAITTLSGAVVNVDLVDVLTTYTGNTPQTADHTAGIADIPTVAEFNARTIVAANYFDPAADAVANVTLVATTTTNTDMRGTDNALLASTFSTMFSGITALAEWLGLIAGKQAGNATALTEIKATGAGSGTYDPTTDSNEATRDRGDSAWITATGFSTLVATDIVSAGAITTLSGAVVNVDLVDTLTTYTGNTVQTADHTAGIADIPTVAEFNARTLVAAAYFDPAADTVANVTLVATTTTNTDMRGTDGANTVVPMLGTLSQTEHDATQSTLTGLNNVAATDIVSNGAITTLAGAVVNVDLVDTLTTYTGNTLQTADVADLITTVGVAGAGLTDITINAASVDLVWDEILTGLTHNITNSSGKRLRQIAGDIFTDGTAQSGGLNSLQLASGDVSYDGEFERARLIVTDGTGFPAEFIITSSVASTDTVTFTPAANAALDVTTTYQIVPGQVHTTVQNGGYDNGFVFVDTVNGAAGTVTGVNGTSTNPSSNLTDAYVIAASEMLTKYDIEPGSTVTLPSDSSGKQFFGSSYVVLLNGQNIGNTRFEGASLSGVGVDTSGGRPPSFALCGIGSVTLPPCNGIECGFFGTFTIGTEGNFTFGASADVFNLSLTVDFGAALNSSQFFLQSWGGGDVEIQNAGAGTGSYVFQMSGTGNLVVNANCSATTTVTLQGNVSRNADVTGVTYVETANVWQDTINAEVDTALADYDGPTKTEMDTAHALLATVAKQDIIDTNVDQIEVAVITNAAGADISADIATLQTSIDGVPTTAEFEARTLVAASYFDPAADTVANVTTVGSVTTKTGYALVSTGLDLVLVDGKTLPASLQIIGAVVAGEITGAGTGTEVFDGLDGATTRVTVTVDGAGNRSTVVYT